jgi:hypothetical protein
MSLSRRSAIVEPSTVADVLNASEAKISIDELVKRVRKRDIDATAYDVREIVWQLVDAGRAAFTDDWRVRRIGRKRRTTKSS